MIETVGMASQIYTSLQTHEVVYIKYVQLSVCQSYLNKAVKKMKS